MKKIVGILVAAGIVLVAMSVAAVADPNIVLDEDAAIIEEAGAVQQYKNKYGPINVADTELVGKERIKNRNLARLRLYDAPSADIAPKKYAKLKGIWGLAGDNESDGYFGGRLIRRGRSAVFKGVYNKTDNESWGKVFGIMKHGFFNGKVVNPDGRSCRITGLYLIDKENMAFKMRWMTPHSSGWAVARILTGEE